jgi:nicotinamide mononucleotide transporter
MDVLSQTVFTLWGYPLSILEMLGVVSGLIAVFLAWKELPVNFLVGLFNFACYFLLFYQFRLYSVMLLQVVYAVFSVYGYYNWKHPKQGLSDKKNELRIQRLEWKKWMLFGLVVTAAGLAWGWLVIQLQAVYPEYVAPPAYPWIDALLTMASIGAQWMLSKKYWDNWIVWLVVDVSSTVFYGSMGMVFTAVMYGIFSLIALKAIVDWKRTIKQYDESIQ